MNDHQIIDLYWARDEAAILETDKKYGRYCYAIAYNILYSNEDAEECVSDTYGKAWQSIPPHKPNKFSAFLGKITRNLALNRFAYDHAAKRNAPGIAVLAEAQEGMGIQTEDHFTDEVALKDVINRFMDALPQETRIVFLRRYWYFCTIEEIAKNCKLPQGTVKSILARTRKKFREFLTKEGIFL